MLKPGLIMLAAAIVGLLAFAPRSLARQEVFAFEQTRIDVGRVPDAQPVKRGFKFTNISNRAQKIVIGHCHFCPQPQCDKTQLSPGESAVVVLELSTMGEHGEAEATADISAAGERDSIVHIALAARVCPSVRIEPTQAYVAEVPQSAGTHVTAAVVGRKKDFQVTGVQCSSDLLTAKVGEATKVQDLDEECTSIPVTFTLRPGAPLGKFAFTASILTNDPRRDRIAFAVEGAVVGDVYARPDHVTLPVVKPGRPFSASFELLTRSGAPLMPGAVVLEPRPTNGVRSCVLDCVMADEPGVLRVTISGLAPERAMPIFDFPVLVRTRDSGERVTVPIRISVRDSGF